MSWFQGNRDVFYSIESRSMRTLFIFGGLFIGYGLVIGPPAWHTGASMVLVHQLGVAWAVWGVLFAAYALLLLNHHTRVFGYFLGFVLYSFYAGSFVLASTEGHLSSVVLLVVSINATIQQAVWGIKTMIEETRR